MSSSISLYVPKKLSTDQAKIWYQTIQNCLPKGLIGATTLYANDSTKESSFYCQKISLSKWCYVIPLVRDITESEIHEVVKTWNNTYPVGDFLIDYSQKTTTEITPYKALDQNKIQEILDSWAKHQHSQWMSDLINKGWKFGVTLNTKQCTHPLLQPWEQLPNYARSKNIAAVKALLKIIDSQGYTISQKPDA